MNHLKFLLILFPFALLSHAQEKQIAFRELTVEYGLSQNSVVSIAQDSTGYMWFATQDGLNKYDGRKFTHFNYQFEDVTRSTFSRLGKVYIDKNDDVWIISNSGILHKLNKSTQNFKKVENLKNVSTLYHSKNRTHFFGTYGNGIYKLPVKSQDTVQILNQEHRGLITYDFFEYKNSILCATSNGIIKINPDNNYEYITIESNTNFSAFTANKDTVFVGSYGKGLYYSIGDKLDFKRFTGFEKESLPENLIIQDILIDARGLLWIATYGDGAYLVDFKKETIQHFIANKTNPYALHYNDVLSLYEDFTGIVWLGTDGSGLSYYDEDLVKFNVLTNKQAPDNINIDYVRAIAETRNQVWLGTSNRGLTAINFETDSYTKYTTSNSNIASDRIMSLNSDGGDLWIGHQNNGLQKLSENGEFRSFPVTRDMSVWKIYKAPNDRFWLCTLNGLILFDETQGVIKNYSTENSNLGSNSIRTVEDGEANQLWIGTESDGLYKMDIATERIVKIEQITDRIKSLFYDDEILWVGTNGNGLKSFNIRTQKINHYTTNEGLANNVIYGILQADESTLWLSSNNGLTRASIDEDTVLEFENFSNYDGLQTNEFNTGAYLKGKNGYLYFGGLEGINWFNPNQLTYNSQKPKTILTDFEIFAKSHPLIENAVFPSHQNTMTFTFSGLHYSQPERNQYKYQLVNHDPDWIAAGNQNTAHYTNLPPDDYTFRVVSSNYDGIWSEEPASYSFTIKQPWYLSKLALLSYFLLAVVVIITIYRYLKWRWKMQLSLQLEHEETERLKKLDELKTKLYTNISHEFRTPLTLIKGPIENQLRKKDIDKADRKELNLVKQNANRLLNLVSQMLDLSMVDSGQQKLKVSKGNLVYLLKQLVEAFQYQAKSKNIQLVVSYGNLKDVWYDKDVVEKIISNLLSNAIKYAPKNSEIQFSATQNNESLILSIINQTNEVTLKNLNHLFQRFYQDDEASDGVGVGLALVKELVNLSKGTIVANNVGDSSIQFSVTLPATKEAFNEDEIVLPVKNPRTFEEPDSMVKHSLAKPKILIVEDNDEIREYVVSLFKNSYHIVTANNGIEGINHAVQELPDIIISDVMMPLKDGIELCHDIKTNILTSHIPVILLTAKVGEENTIQGLETGADAYITKPFSAELLKVRVENLLQNSQRLYEHFSKTFEINPKLALTNSENQFLKQLKQVIEENYSNPEFNAEEFASKLNMSRSKLHRKLTATLKMSTTEFIRTQRLKISKTLLEKSDRNISEIAYEVGFNSVSYFNKCFKAHYGKTPTEINHSS